MKKPKSESMDTQLLDLDPYTGTTHFRKKNNIEHLPLPMQLDSEGWERAACGTVILSLRNTGYDFCLKDLDAQFPLKLMGIWYPNSLVSQKQRRIQCLWPKPRTYGELSSVPTLPYTSCVAKGKSHIFSVPQFPTSKMRIIVLPLPHRGVVQINVIKIMRCYIVLRIDSKVQDRY